MTRFHHIVPIAALGSLLMWWLPVLSGKLSEPAFASWNTNQAVSFSCIDTVTVSLDGTCQFQLSPVHILEGEFPVCISPADFWIIVDDANPQNGPVIDGPGTYKVAIGLKSSAVCTDFTTCWSIVVAEDKTGPQLQLPPNITLSVFCTRLPDFQNNPSSLAITGKAIALDNCNPAKDTMPEFNDQVEELTCDTLLISRTFVAKDRNGNRTLGKQLIKLGRPKLQHVELDSIILLDAGCARNREFPLDAQGNVHPRVTGYPYIIDELGDTTRLYPGETCGLSVVYQDDRFSVCPAAYKLIRRWKILDWCAGKDTVLIQQIKIGDVEPPRVSCSAPRDSFKLSTDPFSCTAALLVPAPQVVDSCSAYTWQASVVVEEEQVVDGQLKKVRIVIGTAHSGMPRPVISGIPVGCHELIYTVRDACENTATAVCTVCVADKVDPLAICDDQIRVSLDDTGAAYLTAKDIDEGSRDNCQLARIKVRRKYTEATACYPVNLQLSEDWSDRLWFSCCDVGQPVTVELGVWDLSGNFSYCWTEITVEDKQLPRCVPPRDTMVDCLVFQAADFDYHDPVQLASRYGTARVIDNCEATVTELAPIVRLNQCLVGYIDRRFTVQDKAGNKGLDTCFQRIEVLANHNYQIRFPKDYIEYCKNPTPQGVTYSEWGCDIIAVSQKEERFDGEGQSCYKIFRTFGVINWCEYNGRDEPVIVPRNPGCRAEAGTEDVFVTVRPDGKVYYDADGSETNTFPKAGEKKVTCDGRTNPEGYWISTKEDPNLKSRGIWQYTQIIRVVDNEPPTIFMEDVVTICTDRPDCLAEVVLSLGVSDNCQRDVNIVVTLDSIFSEYYSYSESPWHTFGRYPKYLVAGLIPVGEYVMNIKVDDQCGNVSRRKVRVEVVDCKAPAPVCIQGLAVPLMQLPIQTDIDDDGETDVAGNVIWAKELIKSSLEICSNPVTYSINRAGDLPDPKQDYLTLTCADQGYLEVEVYAWDNAFNPSSIQPDGSLGGPNYNYCETYILVQDVDSLCSGLGSGIRVAGKIAFENAQPLAGVDVRVSGSDDGFAQSNQDGFFQIDRLKAGGDYSILPRLSGTASDGVSTLDMVMITRHILGDKLLESPYQLLAADVNRSGSVSTLDLIAIRKIVLNIDSRFASGDAWRFVAANHRFRDVKRPWSDPIPEVINLNNLSASRDDLNFVAVKLGDVSGSLSKKGNTRSDDLVPDEISVPDLLLEAGKNYKIPIYLAPQQPTLGLQFGIRWVATEITVDYFQSDWLTADHFNLQESSLLMSWNGNEPISGTQTKLGIVSITPRQTLWLHEALQLDNRILHAESYQRVPTLEIASKPLVLTFAAPVKQVHGLTMQSFPNPFQQELTIDAWWSGAPCAVTCAITNALGQLVYQEPFELTNGANRIALAASLFPAKGWYQVRLITSAGETAFVRVLRE
ncbi:MAG: hypothetical protein H6555_06075 [Lewinellaceae bacterium]|nr:hypothetical protein [Lewinellaceae bacterium]